MAGMEARYKFDKRLIDGMPLTMEFTATTKQWRELVDALQMAEVHREASGQHADPIRPLTHCVVNLMKAVNDAAGYGYKTRGYSYDYETTED